MAKKGLNLGLSYGWALGESGYNVQMDENFLLLDSLLFPSVLSASTLTPPAEPTVGDRYIVPKNATVAGTSWEGFENHVVIYTGETEGWFAVPPKTGWNFAVEDAEGSVTFGGVETGWAESTAEGGAPAIHSHDDLYYTESEVDLLLADKAPILHNHPDTYYTKDQVEGLLLALAPTVHGHDDRYYTEAEIDDKFAAFDAGAPEEHNHDDLYYTKEQVTTKLSQKADAVHSHPDVYYDKTEVYNQSEIDAKFDEMANHTHDDLYYTEAEIDARIRELTQGGSAGSGSGSGSGGTGGAVHLAYSRGFVQGGVSFEDVVGILTVPEGSGGDEPSLFSLSVMDEDSSSESTEVFWEPIEQPEAGERFASLGALFPCEEDKWYTFSKAVSDYPFKVLFFSTKPELNPEGYTEPVEALQIDTLEGLGNTTYSIVTPLGATWGLVIYHEYSGQFDLGYTMDAEEMGIHKLTIVDEELNTSQGESGGISCVNFSAVPTLCYTHVGISTVSNALGGPTGNPEDYKWFKVEGLAGVDRVSNLKDNVVFKAELVENYYNPEESYNRRNENFWTQYFEYTSPEPVPLASRAILNPEDLALVPITITYDRGDKVYYALAKIIDTFKLSGMVGGYGSLSYEGTGKIITIFGFGSASASGGTEGGTTGGGDPESASLIVGSAVIRNQLTDGEEYSVGTVIPVKGKYFSLTEDYTHTELPAPIDGVAWSEQVAGDTPDLGCFEVAVYGPDFIAYSAGEELVTYDHAGTVPAETYLKIPFTPLGDQKTIALTWDYCPEGLLVFEFLCDTAKNERGLMGITSQVITTYTSPSTSATTTTTTTLETTELFSGWSKGVQTVAIATPASGSFMLSMGSPLPQDSQSSPEEAVYLKSVKIYPVGTPFSTPVGNFIDLKSLSDKAVINEAATEALREEVLDIADDLRNLHTTKFGPFSGYSLSLFEGENGSPQVLISKGSDTYVLGAITEGVKHLKYVVKGEAVRAPIEQNGNGITRNNLYTIDWGDGTIEHFSSDDAIPTHTYADSTAEHTVILKPQEGYEERGWLSSLKFHEYSRDGGTPETLLRILEYPTDTHCLCGNITHAPAGFGSYLFYDCENLTSLGDFQLPKGILTTESNFCSSLCRGCSKLTSLGGLQIPKGITKVGDTFFDSAFSHCDLLTDLGEFTSPVGITSVGFSFFSWTFADCGKLQSSQKFNLPQGLTKVDSDFCEYLFNNCILLSTLPELQIPQGITLVNKSFLEGMFLNCESLSTLPEGIQIPPGITSASSYFCSCMFNGCSLTTTGDLRLPQNITFVPRSAEVFDGMFGFCKQLISIEPVFRLPEAFTEVGNDFCGAMFRNCYNLSELNGLELPQQDITSVGVGYCSEMFSGCSSLVDIGTLAPSSSITSAGGGIYLLMFKDSGVADDTNGFPSIAWVS